MCLLLRCYRRHQHRDHLALAQFHAAPLSKLGLCATFNVGRDCLIVSSSACRSGGYTMCLVLMGVCHTSQLLDAGDMHAGGQ